MGQRQSVPPPGRPKTYATAGYVTTTEGGLTGGGVGRAVSFAAQPGPNAGLVVGYPGPVTRTAPATAIRSPATGLGYPQPGYPRRPAPAPPVSLLRPMAAPFPPGTMTQHPAQRPPMTTQPTSSALNVFPGAVVARDRTLVNSTGISPVGSDNGSATSSSAAAMGGGEGGGGMLEALQAISLSSQFSLFADLKCPVCHKTIPTDNIELHLLQCLTKPEIIYNEDILLADKGECSICFDELEKGNRIARLPCLCVYHKSCIDDWFAVSRCCPEHPDN